ncbi:MAG TPA: lytic transglycosylase domain-containing protein [Bryobacteraceae bacterium]|nr:lytic transglycosylase domain-containing protein [Bryobacteraceae bacterium]
MLPFKGLHSGFGDKFMQFCSILILAMMGAGAVLAASDGRYSASRTTSTVRADEKTGHLIRNVVARAESSGLPSDADNSANALENPAELTATIDRIAAEQGVENLLVHSVIRAESNYNPRAVSPKGAEGIMQLIPSTAKRFGVNNIFDPIENILGGVKYLKFLLDYYQNDYVRAIAAYNAGEAAVDKYNGIPPFSETRNYVYRVSQNLKTARANQISVASATPVETYKRIETSVGSDGRIYYRTP